MYKFMYIWLNMVKIKFVTVPQRYATKILDTTSLSLAKLDGNYTYIYIFSSNVIF